MRQVLGERNESETGGAAVKQATMTPGQLRNRGSVLEELLAAQIHLAGLPEPVREYRFCPSRRFRADFAWPERRLLCEVDGGTWVNGRHSRGAGFEKDCEKMNLAAQGGWLVVRFTGGMVNDGTAIAVLRAMFEEGKDD